MRNWITGIAVALLVWGLTATDGLAAEGKLQKYENHADCYVWNGYPQPNETVTWSGSCKASRADGDGTLVWRYKEDGNLVESRYTGTMRNGEANSTLR